MIHHQPQIMSILFNLLLLFIFISLSFASNPTAAPLKAQLLHNRDFESPPTNITTNSTSPFFQLTGANTIPGWSHNGTVRYVSSGPNISLPGNGHALQLGQSGKINQTIRDDQHNYGFVLTFILFPPSKDCFNNFTAVNVSVPGISKVFFLNGHYGKRMWETHGFYMGLGSVEEPFNLVIEKVSIETGANLTCDPIVDELLVRTFNGPRWYDDATVANYGFEEGPGFTGNYSEGILLHEEPDYLSSPLQQWSVLGTVKYIDSKHYKVPEGKAAIELLTGDPSGITVTVGFLRNLDCRLNFSVADAKDSCLTNFTVFARAGTPTNIYTLGEERVDTKVNFTMSSNGTGSVWRYSMPFKVKPVETEVSIYSSKLSQTRDGIFCGPVIDNVKIQCSAASPTSLAAPMNLLLSFAFISWVLIELVLKNMSYLI